MNTKNKFTAVCIAFTLSFGCAVQAFSSPMGVLVIVENETPENLDPANATNSTVNQLLIGVYDTLVQFSAGETAVSPRLATDWNVSDDGLTYTFNLRGDAVFHDGTPLTVRCRPVGVAISQGRS